MSLEKWSMLYDIPNSDNFLFILLKNLYSSDYESRQKQG